MVAQAAKVQGAKLSASVTTEDGAIVIPNSKNLVGVSEIAYSFEIMPGIDPRLIPKGWIRNHLKWIVWKLVSYERMFPTTFQGCLCIENIIQQLKYRYDREIDMVERSALRRIYERDDAPQKRMILCVSAVKQISIGIYELELTDGWYSIRTVIDEPLNNQVICGKIQIGTKLVIFGAELLNCDGCFPLEATDLTCLKINFNSTRRARWYAKLGYQQYPGPFLIKIETIHPLGGPIGLINVCIVRVYPMKYLERIEGRCVWRNKKAEERRAQKWDIERYKKIESIQEEVTKEFSRCYEKDSSTRTITKLDKPNISNITCPEELLNIIENSKDPESIEQSLASSQKVSLMEYKRNLFLKKQKEMETKIRDEVEKVKIAQRDVVATMKLLIVDIHGNPNRFYPLFVWRPTDCHIQMLRESTYTAVYQVIPKKNGNLDCGAKTSFQPISPKSTLSELYERKVITIQDLGESNFNNGFREFDTVGIVVQTKVEEHRQELWLTDVRGRLLLINISEGPSTCLILDNVKRTQAVTVCNAIYQCSKENVLRAAGNHFSIVSCYPQQTHLQKCLDEFNKNLPKNLNALLERCDKVIESIELLCSSNKIDTLSNLDFSGDDSTIISNKVTSTDVALSLIDMD